MTVQTFALILGIVYLGAGVLGMIPMFLTEPPPDAPVPAVQTLFGYLIGLFPVNILHNLFHLAIGVWGIGAFGKPSAAVIYARGIAIIYGVLAVMGFFPLLNTTFGLIPLYGHDIWLHAGTAAIAAYFGWRGAGATKDRRRTVHDRRQRSVPVAQERRIAVIDRRRTVTPDAY